MSEKFFPMTQSNNPLTTLFDSGGEVATYLRSVDWSTSPLGIPDTWPAEIRVLVKQILSSKTPMCLFWGAELNALYNDAYLPIVDDKHPGALGGRLQDVFSEIWAEVEPLAAQALAGISSNFENHPYKIRRGQQVEQAWFSFSWTPIRDECNKVIGIFCVITETTGQVKADEALRQLNERLEIEVALKTLEREHLWNNSQDLLLILGFDGVLRDVNPAWTELLGWERNELIGKNFLDFIHPDDVEYTYRLLKETANKKLPFCENRYWHKDGSIRWFRWTAAPDKNFIYANGRHVTQELEQEKALQQSAEALRQSQKMEAVGQLTGGLAHDFNNMLGGISGNLEMMKLRASSGRRASDNLGYIDSAMAAVNRAAALTHRLLAFSRRQALAPKPTDVNGLVQSMEDMIRRTLGPNITLEVSLNSELWSALCDAPQLESALLNLAINSRDAMPMGGLLKIETQNCSLSEKYTKDFPELDSGDYVRILVSDTGVGMTPEVLSRAVDPFYTTKPMGQGTGLGLSMIYGFTKQSKGHMRLKSEPGIGTTAQLFLPKCAAMVAAGETSDCLTDPPRADNKQLVLLVDDDETIRKISAEMLTELGYEVVEAGEGAEALKCFESLPCLDLLVTDVGLPNGMNGRQLADAIQIQQPGLKILFITGFAETTLLSGGLLAPGMEVMTKPFSIANFATKVRNMIDSVSLTG